ncbi:MAG TPA: response regulator, partial [Tepidisphaeraceae bacterium]|nr:response regulator [Tepidisphaeraceae bacterium]
ATVQDAVGLARDNPFDLVISDVELPDGTGIELFREINEIRPTQGIAVSGHTDHACVNDCQAAGFAAYLSKPTDVPRLLAAIQKVGRQDVSNPVDPLSWHQ